MAFVPFLIKTSSNANIEVRCVQSFVTVSEKLKESVAALTLSELGADITSATVEESPLKIWPSWKEC